MSALMDDLEAELKWLQAHPEFDERPATIKEFVGPNYLNIEKLVRKAILEELVEIMGDESDGQSLAKYPRAMITGGIGIGKTTIASIVLPYLAHWVLCLKDPQGFFELLPGSRIAFMQMSTSGNQAKQVVFGDIKARIDHSPWFQGKYQYDKNFKTQLRFPKDIWVLPGDSAETTFEGYNILGGILDEADSHQVTEAKDYAEQGYTTISSRITSRFQERGFILVIGQMKKGNGFAARKYREYVEDPDAYAVRMAIWESFGWEKYTLPDGTRDSFWYDSKRHDIVPTGAASLIKSADNLIEIPNTYKQDFLNNPEKALRDLAGIPPLTGSPFISLTYKITEARERWLARYNPGYSVDSDGPTIAPEITTPADSLNRMADWFSCKDPLKRVAHIDLAYSANGDGLGLAVGHVPDVVEIDGERKPYIVIDLIMRIHAPAGREIFLGDVRRIIYWLRDERKFRITKVTMDGFQSTDTMQQLERRRIQTELVSVDRQMLPYYDLREAIYEDRIDFPQYMVKMNENDTELTEVLVKELQELVDNGDKVDHPQGGSKDVADSVAGVAYTLMGDRTYSRKVVRLDALGSGTRGDIAAGDGLLRPELVGGMGAMTAPLPPSGATSWNPPSRGRSR